MHNRWCKCSPFLLEFFTNLIPVIKWYKCLDCFVRFYLYHLLHLFSSHKFMAIQFFFSWIYEFCKNHWQRRLSHNVNLSNLKNVLQQNLRTDRSKEYIFRAFEGTNFEKLCAHHNHNGTNVGSMYVPVCPKKVWYIHS